MVKLIICIDSCPDVFEIDLESHEFYFAVFISLWGKITLILIWAKKCFWKLHRIISFHLPAIVMPDCLTFIATDPGTLSVPEVLLSIVEIHTIENRRWSKKNMTNVRMGKHNKGKVLPWWFQGEA